MKLKRILAAVLMTAMMVSTLAACSSSETEATQEEAAAPGLTAMIVQIPAGDPFIDLAFAGVEELAANHNMEAKIIEALDKSEHVEQVRAMAKMGANPIYVLWDELGEAVLEVAPSYPDTQFIIADAYVESDLENVSTIVVEPFESSFIAGFVAANLSETDHVAFVGSMDNPTINRFEDGFTSGVSYANPDATVEVVYLGTAEDPVKGQETAKILASNGADVIMQAANKSGLGVIEGCVASGVLAIGVDEWQGYINEDVVIWSALKDITSAILYAGESALDGSFESGLREYTLSDGIAMYDDRDYDKLPDDVKEALDVAAAGIKDGSIVVNAG